MKKSTLYLLSLNLLFLFPISFLSAQTTTTTTPTTPTSPTSPTTTTTTTTNLDIPSFKCFNIPQNASNVCSGRGTCIAQNTCKCIPNYIGPQCTVFVPSRDAPYACFTIPSNSPNVCSGHGECVATDNCRCNIDYQGSKCELPICRISCVHGNCTPPDTCTCHEGYQGRYCDIAVCFGIEATNHIEVCSGNGQCVAKDNCTCYNGYEGDRCDVQTSCFGYSATSQQVCNGNGRCISRDICECNSDYEGEQCNRKRIVCFGFSANNTEAVCSGCGTCVNQNTCDCLPGCSGVNCERKEPKCFGEFASSVRVCNGNGKCISDGVCNCFDGFTGDQCDIQRQSSANGTSSNTTKIITCFGINSANLMVCSGNGICLDVDTCNCSIGWIGDKCQTRDPNIANVTEPTLCFNVLSTNTSSVCSGRGSCVSKDTCSCQKGYYGSRCQFAYPDIPPPMTSNNKTTANDTEIIPLPMDSSQTSGSPSSTNTTLFLQSAVLIGIVFGCVTHYLIF